VKDGLENFHRPHYFWDTAYNLTAGDICFNSDVTTAECAHAGTCIVFGVKMLKKAQRDIGNTVRKTMSSLSNGVDDELTAAFHNFSLAVMSKEVDVCTIRAEYLQMDARQLVNVIFTKLRQLYTIISNIQVSWEGDAAYSTGHSRRKALNRGLSIVSNFTSYLGTDSLMQKMFKVFIYLFKYLLFLSCCMYTCRKDNWF